MFFVVGVHEASIIDWGSRVCLHMLCPDRSTLPNYQSDCLSTLFAWISISALPPSGECVGDGSEEVSGVTHNRARVPMHV